MGFVYCFTTDTTAVFDIVGMDIICFSCATPCTFYVLGCISVIGLNYLAYSSASEFHSDSSRAFLRKVFGLRISSFPLNISHKKITM